METLYENIVVYSLVFLTGLALILFYVRRQQRNTRKVDEKIRKAKAEGLFEPVSLHPVIDPAACIGSGACIAACPEKDILGIRNGKATTINASRCVGHGACFHACPTRAITLCIGTEKRGVDLPHVNEHFESSIRGIYIAGELGGMGLIRNSVEQGRKAVENMIKAGKKVKGEGYDLIIVGAGPAGISATLAAKKYGLNSLTLEQDTLGGAVYSFPRSKVIMTSPMELPLFGKIKLGETTKPELLGLWNEVLKKYGAEIRENTKVENIISTEGGFRVETGNGERYNCRNVILAIGRRGSPRKLNIPGENLEKVAYRLLDPDAINGRDILIVGGGDSAVEAALSLSGRNRVILSYRGDAFGRIRQKNKELLEETVSRGGLDLRLGSSLISIGENTVNLGDAGETKTLKNDLVYIFAGGQLPSEFLQKIGLQITTKYGEALLKHN